MKIIQAPRASAILYNLLISRHGKHPWLLPANICPIVPITFFKAQVPFEFVDISAETLHMDLNQTEERLRRGRIGGILYAHTYGESSTPDNFFALVKTLHPEITLIDDRCLCSPDLEPTASVADVILYSTGYAKIVDLGFGGYAFTKDNIEYQATPLPFNPQDHEAVEKEYKSALRNRTRFQYHDMDWLEAECDLPSWYDYCQKIKIDLGKSIKYRAALNDIYKRKLPVEIQLPSAYQAWRFNIRVKHKQSLLDAIFSKGLFASSHYASLAGIMADGFALQAERLAGDVINLFNDHHFTPLNAELVCEIILENLSWKP